MYFYISGKIKNGSFNQNLTYKINNIKFEKYKKTNIFFYTFFYVYLHRYVYRFLYKTKVKITY